MTDHKDRAPYDFDGLWIHFVVTTYGAWIHGDERGFRTRHHRHHVEGDYKNPPPPEAHRRERERARHFLKQDPVVIPLEWRVPIATTVRTRLVDLGTFVLCLAQGGQHLHLLAKLRLEASPRTVMGLAKLYATYEAKRNGWQGKLWAKRGKEQRIRDREHQQNVYRYILAHENEGASVWDWRAHASD